jgi:phage terminase small subunit
MKKELSKQERLFALEYLSDPGMNAEEAALKAGYSRSVARKKAYSWVGKSGQNSKPHVLEFIQTKMKDLEKKYDSEIEILTKKLKQIFEIDFIDVLEEMGWELTIEGLKKVSAEKRVIITNVIQTKEGIRLVLFNKERVTEMLAKRFGLWENEDEDGKVKISINTNGLEKFI